MAESVAGLTTDGEDADQPDNSSELAEWSQLSERAVTLWRLRSSVGAIATLAVLGFVFGAVSIVDLQPSTGVAWLDRVLTPSFISGVIAALSASVVLAAIGIFVIAPRRYRRWRWRLATDTLVVEHGWWRHRRARVPIVELHTLSERAGPVMSRWRVCKLRAYSSGPIGSVTLPVLDRGDVALVRRGLGFDDDER